MLSLVVIGTTDTKYKEDKMKSLVKKVVVEMVRAAISAALAALGLSQIGCVAVPFFNF